MTTTDERSKQHRRDMIVWATKGQLGAIGKSTLVIAALLFGLLASLSVAGRQDARGSIVAVQLR